VRIKNKASGRYMEPLTNGEHHGGRAIALADFADRASQHWRLIEGEKAGWYMIQNRLTGNVLTLNREFGDMLHEDVLRPGRDGRLAQTFLITEHYGEPTEM